MKQQKPEFRTYYETRLRHPLQMNDKIVYIGADGQKYHDVGSPHTVIILTALILHCLITLGVFYWTKFGFTLVLCSAIFSLGLHRIFRYFWTSFEKINGEGNLIEDKSHRYAKRRRQRSDKFWAYAYLFGVTKPKDTFKYSKYNGWQKALIFIEAVAIIGLVFIVPVVTADSPYSRLCSIEAPSIPWYDNPMITSVYTDEPITIDYNFGKVSLEPSVDTLLETYRAVRSYIHTFCPEAEITDYAVELHNGKTKYYFTFKNFRRGLLYKEAYKIISVDASPDKSWMRFDYFGYYAIDNWFEPVKPPEKEIDVERIVNLIFSKTKTPQGDVEYMRIGTHFQLFKSQNLSDQSGDAWAVYIGCGDTHYYYTVNLADNTVIQEDCALY